MPDKKDLKKVGKITLPRQKILQILESAEPHHMSAQDVYRKLLDAGEDVALATIYRVLTQFEEAGLVKKHNFEGGEAIYEIDQGLHHDHLICVECGFVQEFIDEKIEERQENIASSAGFIITDHNLTIYGICKACQIL